MIQDPGIETLNTFFFRENHHDGGNKLQVL